jgi:prepilin-type N-terminal cleavage/methylation domain-containing protein
MINNKGFTLLELLVVTAILGILIGVSSTAFIGILRSQNKINATNEVRQNANLAIELFERDARSASNIVPQTASNQVTLKEVDVGGDVVWACVESPGVNGKITRNTASVTNEDPVDGVDILCGGALGGFAFIVSTSETPIATFRFDALQGVDAPARADFEITLPFETTVGVRDFN